MIRLCVVLLLLTIARLTAQELPSETSALFSGSGTCVMCHESDGLIMIENGKDVSPVTQWRSTMMANSAKDPLWRAKVATELAQFPQHSDLIQNRCTVCHVPAGYTQNLWDEDSTYTFAQLDNDPLARDGVTCTACHQIQPGNLGTPESYNGGYQITGDRDIFGPYPDPLTGPMVNFVNFNAVHSPHVNTSELCAACHTLMTPTLDQAGNVIGEFPEQTPYIEWKNSFYSQGAQVSCQSCHMRTTVNGQDISLMPPPHQVIREPYYQHLFVGANVTMLEMLRDNAEALGVTAQAQHFDTTIAEAQRSLRDLSCDLDLESEPRADSTIVHVTITNLTGHKLPTGIPLRRMWLHLEARDAAGNLVFESGRPDDNGEIVGYDAEYEPHYDMITNEDQVQVYEAVLGDDQGQRTWTLLRAATHLKDNRLPPLGFTTEHASYDTVEIYGVPPSDSNFNRVTGAEGSGSDRVTYRLPPCSVVHVAVFFQTIQPRLVGYLDQFDLPETDQFVNMYNAQSRAPLLMTSASLVVNTEDTDDAPLPARLALSSAYPNPFNGVTRLPVEVTHSTMVEFSLYDIRGRRVMLFGRMLNAGRNELTIDASELASGVYLLRAQAGDLRDTQRLILLK
ncbi:MAG: T9SS type A sorting domain-containing protein [bacterium]|nr:T9SS type A sorting domain-containing protein [bacterium]